MDEKKTVLLNDLTACRQKSGVGCYTHQLLRHLAADPSNIRVIPLSQTFAGRPLTGMSKWYDRLRKDSRPESGTGGADVSWKKRCLRWIRQHGHAALDTYLRTISRVGRWQVYHEPDAVPLSIDAPTVSTMHDLSVLLFPRWHPKHRVEKYERHLRAGLEHTSQFIAVSEATKRDMVEHLGLAAERIHVVPEAPRPEFRPLSAESIARVRKQLDLPDRFLLYVGTIEPRKNVAGLLRSYARLPESLRSRCPLVLAGGWGWQSETVRQMLERSPWKESVRWIGYLEDDQLVAVMNAAEALVYPSFYEGFGLPPLEAMACGTPVITTHAGSLKEVVADAAIVVDPNDEDDLTLAMRAILLHREIGDEYRQRGRQHVLRFDWKSTARATREVYRKVA